MRYYSILLDLAKGKLSIIIPERSFSLISSHYVQQDFSRLKEPPSPSVKLWRVQQERRKKTARQCQFPCSIPTMAFFTHSLARTLHFKTRWDIPEGGWRAEDGVLLIGCMRSYLSHPPPDEGCLPSLPGTMSSYPSGLKEQFIIRCLRALLLVHFSCSEK